MRTELAEEMMDTHWDINGLCKESATPCPQEADHGLIPIFSEVVSASNLFRVTFDWLMTRGEQMTAFLSTNFFGE